MERGEELRQEGKQKYSLEQIRFLNRINNASRRMNHIFRMQSQQVHELEKDKYARRLEEIGMHNLEAPINQLSAP